MLDNSFSFADWHKRHSLYMWRCFCWFGENNLGKVILLPLAFGIWFVMVGILLLLCLKTFEQCFQASRFFYWVWCSSSCKHENWWCYKCFCNLNTVRDCKCLSAIFLLWQTVHVHAISGLAAFVCISHSFPTIGYNSKHASFRLICLVL